MNTKNKVVMIVFEQVVLWGDQGEWLTERFTFIK